MPDISSIGHGQMGPLSRNQSPPAFRENGAPIRGVPSDQLEDRVELSDRARFLDRMRQMPEVRLEKIRAVRASIAAGTYETEGKLEAAIERLLEEADL
jgi:anti-sigma28 factor (negative regulator of flagellin synthesis)